MYLIDWNILRALHTPHSSDDYVIVKEVKIGQSAAKIQIMLNILKNEIFVVYLYKVQRLSP